jgi:DNA-binding beta-propeller fold protein YncE
VENLPTLGDSLAFETQKGDEDTYAIPLDGLVDAANLTGVGLASLTLDTERGFVYAASKEVPYLFALDVRDDSGPGVTDLDYLDVEAVLGIQTASGGAGFREVLPIPGTNRALALNDSPTTIMVFDLSNVVDDDYSELLYDDVVGYLPAARGNVRDVGVDNQSSIGPGQLLMHPDGKRLFVTNFNANSISVYDMTIGPYGTLIDEIDEVGEAPYGMTLTPDGNYLVFANTLGEVDGLQSNSTLGVLDVDPTSDTYLQMRTWIANL